MKNQSEVTFLIERYYQTQEHRIAMGNQIFQLEEAGEPHEKLQEFFDQFHKIEKGIAKYLASALKDHPMWPWFQEVKGIGPILASALIANIDIAKAEHVSSLWKYCGLAVDLDTGEGEKRQKGKKITWNPFLKMTCWKIGESFVKTKGKYRHIYDTSKDFYKRKFPTEVKVKDSKIVKYTKGHIHAMAKRRAVKLFLSDLYIAWRTQEGLPVSEPFTHRTS